MVISKQERDIFQAMKLVAAPDPEIILLRKGCEALQKLNQAKNIALSFLPFGFIKSSRNRVNLISNLRDHIGDLSVNNLNHSKIPLKTSYTILNKIGHFLDRV